ncbi:MAG: NifU family protein [Myxococcota bacterium]
MGRLRELVSKVKEEVTPLAAVVKEEVESQVEKVVERVLSSSLLKPETQGTSAQDEWAFKPMPRAEGEGASSPVETAAPAGVSAKAAEAPVVPAAQPPAAPVVASAGVSSVASASSSPVENAAPPAPVKIMAHPSPTDPSTCKFTVEVAVASENLVRIRSREEAEHSPLAKRIFDIPQVKTVTFAGPVVTVTKSGPEPWPVIARQVGPAIRAFLASGEPAVLDSYQPAETASDKDEALAFRVQQVIESMINPGVAAHGGYVTLLGVRSEIAYIRMGGGCQGCGAADVTLKQGIVTTIKAHVPEIQEVLDSTDHAAGENPFFRDAP